jgi:tricorn protease
MPQGYYRHPTLHGDTLVFTCEDDLWRVPLTGGVPSRLTAGAGERTHAQFSPDGRWLAYTSREEGPAEAWVMPAEGGEGRRLSHFGSYTLVVGWRPDGTAVLVATNAREPFARTTALWEVPLAGGAPRPLPWGPARHVAFAPDGRGCVLGRNTGDPARWKRYRGGTAGELWVDGAGTGDFTRLTLPAGNATTPMWLGDRIYFLADFEDVGNLYSCRPDGSDLRRLTDHHDYYARQATTDGRRIVYHAGADVFVFDPTTSATTRVPITWQAPAPQLGRKFVPAGRCLTDASLHPGGHTVALVSRGKPFVLGAFAGPAVQLGVPQGVRYRLPAWLPGGERLVLVHDAGGDESLVESAADGTGPLEDWGPLDLGRVLELAASPDGRWLAAVNHRHAVLLIARETREVQVVDQSPTHAPSGLAWSPDGRWLAYARPLDRHRVAIHVLEAATGTTRAVTRPVLADFAPAWDPQGRHLYFITNREFDPVYDHLHFDLSFQRGGRPALVTLRPDVPDPFLPPIAPEPAPPGPTAGAEAKPAESPAVAIEFAGIMTRVAVFPVAAGRYEQIVGTGAKVLYTSREPKGAAGLTLGEAGATDARLTAWDLATGKEEVLLEAAGPIQVTGDGKHLLTWIGERLRVLPAGEKPKETGDAAGRDTGWLDLSRVRVEVDPRAEWRQMYAEAWRLQRDQFWCARMSAVDWAQVDETYRPLLARVATRAEFSDLLWEMQGELGTSHAYEWGGDHRPVPRYDQGHLAASFEWDEVVGGWRITEIVEGTPGDRGADSPLRRPGLDVREGDHVLAINGRRLGPQRAPETALVHQATGEVALTLAGRATGEPPRTVRVQPLASEEAVRYRAWVEANRALVHARTEGRCGYLHVPDMGAWGFAEFHRAWLVESERDALVVDVRFNGGGHVSQLLLEKLSRRRIGYDVPRWGAPAPYPDHSLAGPIVGLTNEIAGSDGDIFSHCFKLLGLGPLIGTRTWGGVIGIWPRHALVDGTVTTQPEFAFWFEDVGWGVENHGTAPDIEVRYPPQAYAAGEDPQLERAIAEVLARLEAHPPRRPDFTDRPDRSRRPLPPR